MKLDEKKYKIKKDIYFFYRILLSRKAKNKN